MSQNMQTIRSYKLNPANAKSVGVSDFISEKGAYTGVFTRAELVRSPKGTQGVEFDFKSTEGQHARYLTLWTINAEGRELHGRKVLDAIMTCVGVRAIEAQPITFPKWDAQAGAEVATRSEGFPNLMNTPIGVVLVREEYLAGDRSRKWKNVLVCPYEVSSGRLAGERLENRPAAHLGRMLPLLRDRPLAAEPARKGRADTHDAGGHDHDAGDEGDF